MGNVFLLFIFMDFVIVSAAVTVAWVVSHRIVARPNCEHESFRGECDLVLCVSGCLLNEPAY